jgi:hypothetical protein
MGCWMTPSSTLTPTENRSFTTKIFGHKRISVLCGSHASVFSNTRRLPALSHRPLTHTDRSNQHAVPYHVSRSPKTDETRKIGNLESLLKNYWDMGSCRTCTSPPSASFTSRSQEQQGNMADATPAAAPAAAPATTRDMSGGKLKVGTLTK